MNRNDFTGFINGNKLAGEADIPGVKELITLYPWFHSAHLVLLRALKDTSDIKFDSQLHESAMYVADRSVLYSFLYLSSAPTGLPENEPAEKAPVAEIVAEQKAELITEDVVSAEKNDVTSEIEPSEVMKPQKEEEAGELIASVEGPEPKTEAEETKAPPQTKKEVTVPPTDFSTRTRDELISEIEARLRELAASTTPAAKADTAEVIIEPAPVSEVEGLVTQEETPRTEVADEPQPAVLELESPSVSPVTESIEAEESVKAADDDLLEIEDVDDEAEGDEYVIDVKALKKENPETPSQTDLIDRFIELNPRLQKMGPPKDETVIDLSTESVEVKTSFITETLAKIYISQGYYSKAINIYEKLALQYPEKSAYFASRIEKIKDLIK